MLSCCGNRIVKDYLLVVETLFLADHAAIDVEVLERWGFLFKDNRNSLVLYCCLCETVGVSEDLSRSQCKAFVDIDEGFIFWLSIVAWIEFIDLKKRWLRWC